MSDEDQLINGKQTNDEVDFETLSALLDTALSSDSPAVQDQLKKLLMVAALTSSPDPLGKVHGPFKQMFEEMRVLSSRVKHLEAVIDQARGQRLDREYESQKAAMASMMYPKQWDSSNLKTII